MRTLFGTLQGQIHGLLAPRLKQCLLCGNMVREARRKWECAVCGSCFGRIEWIDRIFCDVCGRYEECPDCGRRKETHFVLNRSAARYDAVMKEWLALYKYRGNERLAVFFAQLLMIAYERLMEETGRGVLFDYITYVPLSETRLRERGFNQAELLANHIGRACRIPVIPLLERVRHTDKQSFKTRSDRLRDLQGVFRCRPDALEVMGGGGGSAPINLLIVDDVYTTGSTLNEVSATILANFNAKIYGLTCAR
jgi:competence protein ComFC